MDPADITDAEVAVAELTAEDEVFQNSRLRVVPRPSEAEGAVSETESIASSSPPSPPPKRRRLTIVRGGR